MAFTRDTWWHVDSTGRKIGWLFPEDFTSILESFYGARKWVYAFMYEFGHSRAQIDRWAKGTAPIPKHVATTVSMMSTMKAHKLPISSVSASWLPDVEGANAKLGPPIITSVRKFHPKAVADEEKRRAADPNERPADAG